LKNGPKRGAVFEEGGCSSGVPLYMLSQLKIKCGVMYILKKYYFSIFQVLQKR
jgi:hypothetical protein